MMKQTYQALVIGTGFGGSVTACRLAQALPETGSVGVLERGKDYRDGSFPRDYRDPLNGWLWSHQRGLFDVKPTGEMFIVQSAGLGGGSLIYANVQMRAPRDVFDAGWPQGYSREALDPYYDLVAHMLSVEPLPEASTPPKTARMEAVATKLERGKQLFRPNLAVSFAGGVNRFGVSQPKCTMCGECDIGCTVGAKNTLDKNYLAEAVRLGAEIGTECEVTKIEPRGPGYRVHYVDHRAGEAKIIDARSVFLCAGAINSTELLLRCRDEHRTLPRLSPALGTRYSANGDFLAFAPGSEGPPTEASVGPVITTAILADRGTGSDRTWYLLEDGGYPRQVGGLVRWVSAGLLDRSGPTSKPPVSAFRGADEAVFLLMGRDRADGRIELVPFTHHLRVVWDTAANMPLYHAEADLARAAAHELGGALADTPMWKYLRQPVAVHNLGGCAMSDHPSSGVTDPWGEVYGYPGLYVLDGAAIPTAVGANPSQTIAAVAERGVEEAIRRMTGQRSWRAPDWEGMTPTAEPLDRVSADVPPGGTRAPAVTVPGVAFTETMHGFFQGGELGPDAYGAGFDHGRLYNVVARFRLTITVPDLDAFLSDPSHPGLAQGEVFASGFTGKNGAKVTAGLFNLFVHSASELRMLYALPFYGADGRPYLLDGYKRISRARGYDVWGATTTLYTTIRAGHSPQGAPLGLGILHLTPFDFARQLTTMHATGTRSPLDQARALLRFGRMFMGSLAEEYLPSAHHRGGGAPEPSLAAAPPSSRALRAANGASP